MIVSVVPLPRNASGAFQPLSHWVARLLRLALFASGILLALSAYRVLGSTLSLLGGLGSITCSLLLPVGFYTLLAWRQLGRPARAGLAAMLALGAALVCLITATNLCDMTGRCQRSGHRGAGSGGIGWGGLLHLLPSLRP